MNPLELVLLNAALNPPPSQRPPKARLSSLIWIVVAGLVVVGLVVAIHNAKPSKKPLGSVKVQ